MSEQNILNPTMTSPLNPDYSVKVTDPQTTSEWQALSGKWFGRDLAARGKVFDLTWQARLFSDYMALDQWFHQYRRDFFSFAHYDSGRYYTGKFAAQPTKEEAGFNKVNISAQFVEIPGLPMYQYPSNWSRDAIFIEERGSWPVPSGIAPTMNDLVKLTGSNWDRVPDRNYCLWSEDVTNAQWTKKTGVTATQVSDTDPRDGVSAITVSRVVYDGSGLANDDRWYNVINILGGTITLKGLPVTASIWMRTESGTATLVLAPNSVLAQTTCNITATWHPFTCSAIGDGTQGYQVEIIGSGNAPFTVRVWAAQYEFGSAATQYAKTTSSPAYLPAPGAISSLHGGASYIDIGTVNTDAAEWMYLGYGFQVWSPKGPWMGIVAIYLDNAYQGSVDLYAAALTASAPIFTLTSVPLGFHRVKLSPTDTKNASSAGFMIAADALQVMN